MKVKLNHGLTIEVGHVEVIYDGELIDETKFASLNVVLTDEGIITDVWEHNEDECAGTSATLVDDLIDELMPNDEYDHYYGL